MGGIRRHQFSSWRVNRSDKWLRNLKPAHQHNARPVILNEQPVGILLMIKFRSAANEESVVALKFDEDSAIRGLVAVEQRVNISLFLVL